MSTKEITEELKQLPDEVLQEIYDFVLFLKHRKTVENDRVKTHFASESALAKDWNTPLEDEAWKDL